MFNFIPASCQSAAIEEWIKMNDMRVMDFISSLVDCVDEENSKGVL